MTIEKIYIGGWFQRTTLHLTEVWDFLKYGTSRLDFSPTELSHVRSLLALTDVTRESGPLEYLAVKTSVGIKYRIYEDGLIILEKDFHLLKEDFTAIKEYYDDKLSKALSLIFSKGAPVPKELTNIQTILPYIITAKDAKREDVEKLFADFSEEIYAQIASKSTEVYRGTGIIFINNLNNEALARHIIESQIFFREFKSQLHRYLTIHRLVWEKIGRIKEQEKIKGSEIDELRNELSDYQKTVHLIGGRIDQMDTYLKTRQKLTDLKAIDEYLQPLFQFKFETLQDTHAYVKNLWKMTEEYLNSAIGLFSDLQQKSTKNTISSLQLITTVGVVAGILGYLGKDTLPKFTSIGLIYFSLLMFMTWIINTTVSKFFKNKKYPLKNRELKKI